MARSRRTKYRSTSQRAVGLLASTLPLPIQRIAETQIGSKILLLGIPALIVAGVLQLDWSSGFPHLSIDHNRAAQLKDVARDEIERFKPGQIQEWEDSAAKIWNSGKVDPQPADNSFSNFPRYAPQQSFQQPLSQQPNYNAYPQQSLTHQQPPPYFQPTYQPPPTYYQPQQYQSYQPIQNGQWRQ